MVRDFQKVIGEEARRQILEKAGRLPDLLVACVGGGSNAMGLFYPFIEDASVQMVGVEAAGTGLGLGPHSASLVAGRPGILHGTKSYLLQDEHGQISPAHSVAPGLDYPGVGPEHSYLKDSGRVTYVAVTDQEALDAFQELTHTEGIIPALESAHAVAYVMKTARQMKKDSIIIINVSGRGDKDIHIVAQRMGIKL
jgi:tryptophan synthase beta chain